MTWRPLTLVMSRGRGWRSIGSAVIRAWPPASRWSHCGVVVGDHVVEALAGPGVVLTPWATFEARSSAWMKIALRCPRAEDGERWALSKVGFPYDYAGALGVPFRQHDEDPDRYECSSVVVDACRAAGNPIYKVPRTPLPGPAPERVDYERRVLTPGHVESLLYAADARLVATGGRP